MEYLPRIHHVAARPQSPRVTVKIERNTREITGRIIFMSMFNDISWGSKDNEKECESNAQLVSLFAKRFGAGQGHSSGLDQRKSGTLSVKTAHKENMVTLAESGHTQCSVPRVHCPEECLKAEGFCKSAQSLRGSLRNV